MKKKKQIAPSFKQVKVKFIGDAHVNRELVFKSGEVKELREDSANRWIRRGKAEILTGKEEKPKTKEKEKAPSVSKEKDSVIEDKGIAKKSKEKETEKESKVKE